MKAKVPRNTPYLPTRWDPIDQYYTLITKEVTEKDFATWWAVVFKRGKVKTLEDAINLPRYTLNNITKSDPTSYGHWTTDLYGGMFGCMNMYISGDFYMDWFPKDILNGEDTKQKRFDYIQTLISKYFN